MGCKLSKRGGEPTSLQIVVVDDPSNGSATSKIQCRADLISYQEACRTDPDIQSFDSSLQQRMTQAVSSIANDLQLEIHALSFDSIKEITGCFLDMNQEVVKIILESKEDIWNSRELFDLVQEYFDNSRQTLDFCAALEKCLTRARDSIVIAQFGLQCFQEEVEVEANVAVGEGEKKYQRTLDELRNFKEAGDPFDDKFFRVFESVRSQQLLMLEKLRRQKQKLDKKLKSVKSWRKVSSVIFVSAVAAILICSVVAAAMAAPPVAAALAAAASVPLGSMGKWIDSLWKGYEKVLKEQKELISTMQLHSYYVKSDLDNIKVLVDNLRIQLESLLSNADFALRGDEAVRFGVEEIKKKLDVFLKSIHDLGEQADRCSRDTRKARTVVLRRIMAPPNGN